MVVIAVGYQACDTPFESPEWRAGDALDRDTIRRNCGTVCIFHGQKRKRRSTPTFGVHGPIHPHQIATGPPPVLLYW